MRTIEEVTKNIADYWIHNLSNSEIKTADDECNYLKGLLNEILEIHKAEKRPQGKWRDSGIGGCKVCTVCNAHMGLSNFKYCPNCGADMREDGWKR